MSYSVHFSFSTFSVFLAIIQVIKCPFLIFHVFQFSLHNQVILCDFFLFSCLSIFHFWHIPCYTIFVSHFSPFSGFLPHSRFYSEHFTYSTFVSVSCHVPGQTLFVSHFSRFFVFFVIFQVVKCAFLISTFFFSVSSTYYRFYSVHYSFFQCFSPYFRS